MQYLFQYHKETLISATNVLDFINIKTDRKIIVDSCLLGMGQGAGNLQTELIIGYLRNEGIDRYNYSSLLDACEIMEKYNNQGLWGYSLTRLLPALNRTAYKYSIALRNKYKLKYSEIDYILSKIPEDLRQRYTPENTIELLKRTGFSDKVS